VTVVRSILFNVSFYLVLLGYFIVAIPTLLMPRRAILRLAQIWAHTNLALLRIICRIGVDWRGLEKIPSGAVLVAAKHQSTWETFALLILFRDPTFILKRELLWIPFYGWFARHAGMIPVDRGGGKAALVAMTARASTALREGRQIVVFPEGTRQPAETEPKYKFGIAHLYAEGVAPCVPVALNSGLFWPRRKLVRYPGTVRVQILDPLPANLPRREFFARLRHDIEAATARLVAEGERDLAA